MSERTFRAVVASVLVGALVLAVVAVVAFLPRSATLEPTPTPSGPPATSVAPPTATVAPSTPTEWGRAHLVGVGDIQQGEESASVFVLELDELGVDAIPDAPGSFRMTLVDASGAPAAAGFVGSASVDAPGSLGVTTRLISQDVLEVSIVASDRYNVEPITVSGLRIQVAPTAALGPIQLRIGAFTGSLAGGLAGGGLPPIATVVGPP